MFKKATKEKAKGRLAIHGPSGAGKTRTALSIMEHLVEPGERIAVIDTEAGSAAKYSDLHDFDVLQIDDTFEPKKVLDAFKFAEENGYGGVILDSATAFWKGQKGFLEMVDEEVKKATARGKKPDSFAAWKTIDPMYQRWIQQLWKTKLHFIFTLRSKMTRERDPVDGKIKTMGYQPEFRDDFIYIFDVEGAIDIDHNMSIGKTRCDAVDGKIFSKPGKEFADLFKAWLSDGAETGPGIVKADAVTPDDVLAKIVAVKDKSEFDAAVEFYKANKERFATEKIQELYRALKTKQEELKGAA